MTLNISLIYMQIVNHKRDRWGHDHAEEGYWLGWGADILCHHECNIILTKASTCFRLDTLVLRPTNVTTLQSHLVHQHS